MKVTKEETRKYQGWKEFPTQNKQTICSFDQKFRYILVGWEGSAPNSTPEC